MRSLLLTLILVVLTPPPAGDAPTAGRQPITSRVVIEPERWPGYPVIGVNSFEQRLASIHAEIESLGDHEWAGSYYGSNFSIELSPQSGAVISFAACGGPPSRMAAEVLQAGHDGIELRVMGPLIYPAAFDWEHLVFIRWGSHRFLLPEAWLASAAGSINLGRVEDFGKEFCAMGGVRFPRLFGCEEAPLAGEPELPPGEGWRIRGHHVRARVLAQSECGLLHRPAEHGVVRFWAQLVLDRGSLDGVMPGTAFRFDAFPDAEARVNAVSGSTCEASLLGVRWDASRPVPVFDVGAELVSVQRLDCPPDAAVEPCFK